MPQPYSLDLRKRIVGFVEDGHSRRAAAAHFKVSVSFVVNVVKAVRSRGSFEAVNEAKASYPTEIEVLCPSRKGALSGADPASLTPAGRARGSRPAS